MPVLSRPVTRPARRSVSARAEAEGSPRRPPRARLSRPKCSTPPRNVPVVSTTRAARSTVPFPSTTPLTRPPSKDRSATLLSRKDRLGCSASAACMLRRYRARSAWLRGPRTAGPREAFSTRNCSDEQSATRPISPPSASTWRGEDSSAATQHSSSSSSPRAPSVLCRCRQWTGCSS